MEGLLAIDRWLFHLLNGVWTASFLDGFMPFVTDLGNMWPLLLLGYLYLLFGASGRYRLLACLIPLVIGFTDPISSRILKKSFNRTRPCCAEIAARRLIGCKTSRSFPSSHAANTAAVAGIVWSQAGWKPGLPLLLVSMVISWSRVYVGVHYPFDVLAGMLVGLLIAGMVARLGAPLVVRLGRRRGWFDHQSTDPLVTGLASEQPNPSVGEDPGHRSPGARPDANHQAP